MFESFYSAIPMFDLSWLVLPQHFKCLLVDDEDAVKSVIARILYQIDEGMSLTYVKNADDAKEALLLSDYDLVIADYMLDERGSGMDILRYCDERHPQLPVVLMSSRTARQIGRESKHHMVGLPYLRKPIMPEECKALIETLI